MRQLMGSYVRDSRNTCGEEDEVLDCQRITQSINNFIKGPAAAYIYSCLQHGLNPQTLYSGTPSTDTTEKNGSEQPEAIARESRGCQSSQKRYSFAREHTLHQNPDREAFH